MLAGCTAAAVRREVEAALARRIPSALSPAPAAPSQMLATGVEAIDRRTGGIPRGALTEICGPSSSGRTRVLLSLLSEATRQGEACAVVDVSDSFDPLSAAEAGVALERVLWVRCGQHLSFRAEREHRDRAVEESLPKQFTSHRDSSTRARQNLALARNDKKKEFTRLAQALKVADLLLQSGGFGVIAMDLGDVPPAVARRVPLASWFRFRRTVENTPTAFVVVEEEPYAKTCASLVLAMSSETQWTGSPLPHVNLFRGLTVNVEIARDRVGAKKPPVNVLPKVVPDLPLSFRAEWEHRDRAVEESLPERFISGSDSSTSPSFASLTSPALGMTSNSLHG